MSGWWNTEPHGGEYGSRTIVPPAWPAVDEEMLQQAAQSFEQLAVHLRQSVIPTLRHQMMSLVDVWDGEGSDAARNEASAIISEHEENAAMADGIAQKLRNMEASVVKTKVLANANANTVQDSCEGNVDKYPSRIAEALNEAKIAEGLSENVQLVAANAMELAGNISASPGTPGADGKVPGNAARPSPPLSASSFPTRVPTDVTHDSPSYHSPVLGKGGSSGASPGGGQPWSPPPAPDAPLVPGSVRSPAAEYSERVMTGTSGGVGSPSSGGGSSASGLGAGSGGAAGVSQGGSAASTTARGSGSTGGSGSGQSASGSSAGASGDKSSAIGGRSSGGLGAQAPSAQPPSAPLTAPGAAQPVSSPPPSSPVAPAAGTSTGVQGFSAAGGSGYGGAPPAAAGGPAPAAGPPPVPLAPPTSPAPSAPINPGAAPGPVPAAPGVAPASTHSGAAAAAPAPVPVSAARAERDAIAAAATAGALRRQTKGNDPTQRARHIAAALNVGVFDFGFYWVTAVTGDGAILVANSYGIGYIPANVALPEGIRMVSADDAIPPGERARWATYPILAVQGWAQHHNQRLRCVIATEDQFEGFDPGAPKIVLQPDDIPNSGLMQGQSRLEIIAPGAAAKLAATNDENLVALLPPAQAGSTPPEDDLLRLWFAVSKPLMSRSTGRGKAHLQAFAVYSDRAMELALHKAQTEPAVEAQRAAIADWVYWQHQGSLISEALETAELV